MQIQPGTIIDRYLVESVLGRGGMAEVYRVRHRQLGSVHAMKVLLTPSALVRERLMQEGRAQAQLRHRNIVTVTDVVEIDGNPGLVMEYISGPTLSGLIEAQASGSIEPKQFHLAKLDLLARGIISGVAAAHEHGLVHRDLKPSNIMLEVTEKELVPKVADFGLVKVVSGDTDSDAGMTRSGMAMGTPAYMAPEQVRDTKTMDHRGDLFALGAILYEILTGRRCFAGEDMMDIFTSVVNAEYTPMAEYHPDIPERMRATVEAALQVDLDERVQSCPEMLEMWCGGDIHSLPWETDDLRWSPDERHTIGDLGSGLPTVSYVSGSSDSGGPETWSGERPAAAAAGSEGQVAVEPQATPASPQVLGGATAAKVPPPDGTLSREIPAPSSNQLQAKPSSSSPVVLFLGVIVTLLGGGWWWMSHQSLEDLDPTGVYSQPTAPAPVAVPVPDKGPPSVQAQDQDAQRAEEAREKEEEERERREEEKKRDEEKKAEAEADQQEASPPTETTAAPVPEAASSAASFSFEGPVEKVNLRSTNGKFFSKGTIPPGKYEIYVPIDGALRRMGKVTVKAGQHIHLVCNTLGCKY